MDCKITNNHGHYDMYIDGKFLCSADTEAEAVREIREEFKFKECQYE